MQLDEKSSGPDDIHKDYPLSWGPCSILPGMRAFKPPRKSSILTGAGYIVSNRQNPEPRTDAE